MTTKPYYMLCIDNENNGILNDKLNLHHTVTLGQHIVDGCVERFYARGASNGKYQAVDVFILPADFDQLDEIRKVLGSALVVDKFISLMDFANMAALDKCMQPIAHISNSIQQLVDSKDYIDKDLYEMFLTLPLNSEELIDRVSEVVLQQCEEFAEMCGLDFNEK